MTRHDIYDKPAAGYSFDQIAGQTYADIQSSIPSLMLSNQPDTAPHQRRFIGTSPVMQALYDQIALAAHSHAPVFITGETGTGKELCAESIHQHSPRRDHPFIAINCAAIPRDLLESELFGHVKGAFTGAISDREGAVSMACAGTLFLDEVAEMAPDMQTKLLRFLQDFTSRKVGGNTLEKTDVRIICATNRAPLKEIAAGRLREDLYFRLHVIPLQMPPLHERGDDVLDIARGLLRRYSQEERKDFREFSGEAQAFLSHYNWPGNVRQLQNVIRYICVMCTGEIVTAEMLPGILLCPPEALRKENQALPVAITHGLGGTGDMPEWLADMTLEEVERYFIESTVQRMRGNVPHAAAHLGVAPSTLYRKRLSWNPDLDDDTGPACRKPC